MARVRQRWAQLTGIDDHDAAVLLADAYCAEHGMTVPATPSLGAVGDARRLGEDHHND